MAWTDLTFRTGETLSAQQLNQLQANFNALTQGAAGAPKIQRNSINYSVYIASMHSNGEQRVPMPSNCIASVPLHRLIWPTGRRPRFDRNLNINAGALAPISPDKNQLSWMLSIRNYTNLWVEVRTWYLPASPPYDLGYGEIPLFLYLKLNRSGEILASWIAQDPPWPTPASTGIHTSTSGAPTKTFQRMKLSLDQAQREGRLAEYFQQLRDPNSREPVELTTEMKNEGMQEVPHPFISGLKADETVVLLYPQCSTCHDFCALLQEDSNEAMDLLYKGHLQLDNTPQNVKTPPGVLTVSGRWKLTP